MPFPVRAHVSVDRRPPADGRATRRTDEARWKRTSPEHPPIRLGQPDWRRLRRVSPLRSPVASAHPRRPTTAGFCGRRSIDAIRRFPVGSHCKSAGSRQSRRVAFPSATEGWIDRLSVRPPPRRASREGQRRPYEATSLPPSGAPPSGAVRMVAATAVGSIMVRRRDDNNRQCDTERHFRHCHVRPVERLRLRKCPRKWLSLPSAEASSSRKCFMI